MKSERRHELRENSLVKGMKGIRSLPSRWRESGSKITLVVIAVLLAVVLYRYWSSSRAEKAQQLTSRLTDAESGLDDFRRRSWADLAAVAPGEFNSIRDKFRGAIEENANYVLQNSDNAAQQAEAKLIRGDLDLELATVGELSAAATQPALHTKQKPAELRQSAAKEYEAVLGGAGSLPPSLVARAHFGLGAIAEDANDFQEARKHYNAVVKDDRFGKSLQNLADRRLKALVVLATPVVIGKPAGPEGETIPTDFGQAGPIGPTFTPASGPSSQPVPTQPSATQPAGAPTPATGPQPAPVPSSGPAPAPETAPATATPK